MSMTILQTIILCFSVSLVTIATTSLALRALAPRKLLRYLLVSLWFGAGLVFVPLGVVIVLVTLNLAGVF